MFDFATKHFLVLSSSLIIASAALSMVTLAAYLTVFDGNLIWLVEYSDLTKLMLIGFALVSSIAVVFIYQIQDAYTWLVKGSKPWKWTLITAVTFSVLLHFATVSYDLYIGKGFNTYMALRALSSLIFVGVLYLFFRHFKRIMSGEFLPLTSLLALLTLLFGSVGSTYSYYVKDVSKHTRDIRTINGDFKEAKVIMLLSHHLAFATKKEIIILRTSDVTQITSPIAD